VFFVDRDPGDIEVVTGSEVEKKLTFTIEAGDTRYVRMAVGLGVIVYRIIPELVDAPVARHEMAELTYTGGKVSAPEQEAGVRVAHDGPQALEAFDACRPGMVRLDLGMHGMDGYEVARRMRASPYGRAPRSLRSPAAARRRTGSACARRASTTTWSSPRTSARYRRSSRRSRRRASIAERSSAGVRACLSCARRTSPAPSPESSHKRKQARPHGMSYHAGPEFQ